MNRDRLLEIESLSVAYGARRVVQDVSLSVARGEVLALIGPNGAGKTTLMRAISGVLPSQSGAVRLAGRDLSHLSEKQRAALLAVVPQARNLPAGFTVWETALMGRTPYLGWLGQPHHEDRELVEWALERTRLLPLAARPVDELSGGEQQRVLLARALAQHTPILLLDEPTSHLDLAHQSILLNLVRELAAERGLAVLMAVHDLNLAGLYAGRVALLVGGRLEAIGLPSEVLTSERLSAAYQAPVRVIPHPDYSTPLVLPDGFIPHGE